jgi:hypothetical protein
MKYGKLFTLGTNATEPFLEPDEPSLQPTLLCLQICSNSVIASTIFCFEAISVFLLHRRFHFACYPPRSFQIFLYFMALENIRWRVQTGYVPQFVTDFRVWINEKAA